jgi:3-deoxy-manno-octulosonate cytidylyltransferase (CMP-KDO synthetase)
MPVLAVIPARLGSVRFPNKPLQLLAGAPLVVRVAERVRSLGLVDEVVVATDAEEVGVVARNAGFPVAMTSGAHPSGTDRVAEVAGSAAFRGFDTVLNVQGDEPFLPGEAVQGALERVELGDDVGTAAAPMTPEEAEDPSRVKVVTDLEGRALYFSRARIPFWRNGGAPPGTLYWQHLGVYAFRREVLARWAALPAAALEEAERLEQLRPLQHGLRIGVARLDRPSPPGIDTPEDLRRAQAHWLAT